MLLRLDDRIGVELQNSSKRVARKVNYPSNYITASYSIVPKDKERDKLWEENGIPDIYSFDRSVKLYLEFNFLEPYRIDDVSYLPTQLSVRLNMCYDAIWSPLLAVDGHKYLIDKLFQKSKTLKLDSSDISLTKLPKTVGMSKRICQFFLDRKEATEGNNHDDEGNDVYIEAVFGENSKPEEVDSALETLSIFYLTCLGYYKPKRKSKDLIFRFLDLLGING
jgi:hypothetical protein